MAARTAGRIRRGISSSAVAAATMVALTASQAPGVSLGHPGEERTDPSAGAQHPADGNSPYHTELPPLQTPDGPIGPGAGDDPAATGTAESGIPATVLAAYKQAERTLRTEQPACNLPWQLLAAIGKVESGQARGGALDTAGNTLEPIRGPVLDGNGFALIRDTDGGRFDADATHDRAVGPMQFIPSTWATWGADGNGDGREDPNNIHDAALAAARYLCAADRDLSRPADLERAVLSYNQSREYLNTVLTWLEFYRKGTHEVPDGTGPLPDTPGAGNPTKPAEPTPAKSPGKKAPTGKPPAPNTPEPPAKSSPSKKPAPPGNPSTVRPTPSRPGADSPLPTYRPTHPPTRPAPTDPTPTRPGKPTEPTPTRPGKPTGRPTPSPTTPEPPAECPTDTASPSPSDSATGSPSPTSGETTPAPKPTATPTSTATPSPTGTGASPSPSESDTEDPKDPKDPKDPCAEESDAADGDGTDGEGGEPSGDGTKGAEPSASPSVSRTIAALAARFLS